MCGIAGAIFKSPNLRAGRAVSADVASGSAHGAGTFSAGGVQTSAQAENRDGQAENGDGSSLADMSQRDEIARLRDTGDHSAAIGAKNRGLSSLSESRLAGSRVSKRVSKRRVSNRLFGCYNASPHDKACRLSVTWEILARVHEGMQN